VLTDQLLQHFCSSGWMWISPVAAFVLNINISRKTGRKCSMFVLCLFRSIVVSLQTCTQTCTLQKTRQVTCRRSSARIKQD